MIDPKFAAEQIARMSGLGFFPSGAALKELRLALESAISDAVAVLVVSRWLEESAEAPKPAQLRAMVWAENDRHQIKQRSCQICDGVGAVTVWQLITYRVKSLTIKRRELLPDVKTQEQADEYTRGLMRWQAEHPQEDDQTVLSAAKGCGCREISLNKQ